MSSTVFKSRPVKLTQFISNQQLRLMERNARHDQCEEYEWFQAKLDEVREICKTMPATYEAESAGLDAIVYLHYFKGSCDAYITERDGSIEQFQAFGLIDLYGDGGELGYICIAELIEAGVELDLHWQPKTLREVKAKREGGAG